MATGLDACGTAAEARPAFARIRRFRACASNLIAERPEAWGRVALAHGYADQAHLNREFSRLSGRSPTQLATYIARIERGAADV